MRTESPPPKITDFGGIKCQEWSASESAAAGVQRVDTRPSDLVGIKVVMHVMRPFRPGVPETNADEGNVKLLWTPSRVDQFVQQVNGIWAPSIRLRLDRVEDCRYFPDAVRLDGKAPASIFTPVDRVPSRPKDPDDVSLDSLTDGPKTKDVAMITARTSAAGSAESLEDLEDLLGKQASVLRAVRTNVTHADPARRALVPESLRQVIAALGGAERSMDNRAGDVRALPTSAGEEGENVGQIADRLDGVADTLGRIWKELVQIRSRLLEGGGPGPNDPEALDQMVATLKQLQVDVGAIGAELWSRAKPHAFGRQVVRLRGNVATIEEWGPERGLVDRQIREAPQLFRAINARFTAVDPHALHIVLWWLIDEFGDPKGGYSRAAFHGGPAVWVDVQCLRKLDQASCGRLLAHEVGHALTLRHVCMRKNPMLRTFGPEPNVDGLPLCADDPKVAIVEGCRVEPGKNLMHPDYGDIELKDCQKEQARLEAERQFRP